MLIVSADALARALDDVSLIDAIRDAFAAGSAVPVRHHHTIPRAGERDATLLLRRPLLVDLVSAILALVFSSRS